MSLKQLRNQLRQRLLRRLFGWRYTQQTVFNQLTLSKLSNQQYLNHHPSLIATDFKPDLGAYEFSYYSQNGEDGIILHLLAQIGAETHYIVEVGIEDGRECNSANLILNYGWQACVIEAASEWAAKARQYFDECRVSDRVRLFNVMATPENIEQQLQQAGVPAQPDIMSIDIDSYDYWLWSAIQAYSPRLVVIEYNASFGPQRSITVPYSADWKHLSKYYHGASITALARLGRRKGYVLAGCDSRGVNAFFVREDLAVAAGIQAVAPELAYRPHFRRTQKLSVERQMEAVAGMGVEEID